MIRVTNDEVTAGQGPALERIKDRCLDAMGALGDVPEEHRAASDLVLNCADTPKIQYAVREDLRTTRGDTERTAATLVLTKHGTFRFSLFQETS